jgi:hypothetical protein
MYARCRMSLRARDVTIRQQDGFDERNCGRQISVPSQSYFPFRWKGVVKRIPHQPPMDLKHLCNSPDAPHSPPVFASYLCIQIDLAFHIHLDFPVWSVNSGAYLPDPNRATLMVHPPDDVAIPLPTHCDPTRTVPTDEMVKYLENERISRGLIFKGWSSSRSQFQFLATPTLVAQLCFPYLPFRAGASSMEAK